ncbi:MAG: alpha/beta hydrolase [Planctomycetota bacterium]|nr:MAG: alpha/beta hydrolase [Planctomycetota bacterium]
MSYRHPAGRRGAAACLLFLGMLSAAPSTRNAARAQTTADRRQDVREEVVVLRDIPYVAGGHDRQKLDLYLPRDAQTKTEPLPVVLWVHGGGWRKGNRFPCPAVFLVPHGYAVASVGYRLSDTAKFPAQIHDCKAAVRFLRTSASKWNLDPNRIGAWGSSAGGHLVALLGTAGNAPELEGTLGTTGVPSSVQAVCDYYGPTDLLRMNSQSGPHSRLDHDAPNSPESQLLGGPLQTQVELAQMASPIRYVDPQDPPFLIVHGDADPLVPHQQSQMLHQALQTAGVPSTLIIVPGGGHGPFREPEMLQRVREFFDQHLHRSEQDSSN